MDAAQEKSSPEVQAFRNGAQSWLVRQHRGPRGSRTDAGRKTHRNISKVCLATRGGGKEVIDPLDRDWNPGFRIEITCFAITARAQSTQLPRGIT
jgi:hypothetical protein